MLLMSHIDPKKTALIMGTYLLHMQSNIQLIFFDTF